MNAWSHRALTGVQYQFSNLFQTLSITPAILNFSYLFMMVFLLAAVKWFSKILTQYENKTELYLESCLSWRCFAVISQRVICDLPCDLNQCLDTHLTILGKKSYAEPLIAYLLYLSGGDRVTFDVDSTLWYKYDVQTLTHLSLLRIQINTMAGNAADIAVEKISWHLPYLSVTVPRRQHDNIRSSSWNKSLTKALC